MPKDVSDALKYLDKEGWSELIDPRWTLQVQKNLQEQGFADEVIKETLNIIAYPEPDYRPENNKWLDDYLK